jgi:hypothetical protein
VLTSNRDTYKTKQKPSTPKIKVCAWALATTVTLTNRTTNGDNPHAVQVFQPGALAIAENFAGINNAATARQNLGLGNVATRNKSTAVGTADAGDDSRFTDAEFSIESV